MTLRKICGMITCVGLLAELASGASVPVPNFSFQEPVIGGFQDNANIVAGTALPNMSNSWYYLGGFSGAGSPVGIENTAANGNQAGGAGTQNGYVNVGAAMGSTNLGAITANQTYFLTVSVAGRFSGFNSTAGATIALAAVPSGTPGDINLLNPANWLASKPIDFATLQGVGNAYADYQTSFTTGTSGGAIGQQLVAVLMSQDNPGFNNPIGFDNVRVNTGNLCGPGDVNCDGIVDIATDFAAIRDHFRLSVAGRSMGDLSGDGVVNFTDFREWKSNYTGPGAASFDGLFAVPEPATASLLLFVVLGICRIRCPQLKSRFGEFV
jgi:HpiC1 cyclase